MTLLISFYRQKLSYLLYVALFTMLLSMPVNAQSKMSSASLSKIPYDEIKTGSLYLKRPTGYFSALRQNSDYKVEVNGLLANIEFSQSFINTSEHYVEAIYVFPLIDDAAVDAMVMKIGERRIVGSIKERQQAKKLYLQAKIQGKKASLVSQQRPNMFTTKVSNIAPGETVKITISYIQSVNYHDDEFSLRIPLTITPRYIPALIVPVIETLNSEGNSNINNVTVINRTGWAELSPPQTRISSGQKVNIKVALNTGLALTNIVSRYHQVIKQQQNSGTTISLANKNVLLDRDFVLTWQVAQGNAPKAAFFQMADNEFNYGLLMIMPPLAQQGKIISKEVVYIIDTSGSMGGVAIKQAKQALNAALDLLNKSDSFNIIAFSSDTDTLFTDSLTASAVNLTLAKHWLSKLSAGGGTNMYPAIYQALQTSNNEDVITDKYKQIVFITDGSVANEKQLFTLIEDNLADTRLHTIGIGSAPNSYFMSRAAELGRGTYRYIGSVNEVSVQMHKLFSDISQPIMRNIKLNWPVENVEFYPLLIPDLYQHQPMIVSAKWPKTPPVKSKLTIKITGQLAHASWQETIDITDNYQNSHQGLDTWWARQKIKHLTQQQRRANKETKQRLKEQITQLALQHQLVSPYTSFVAIEEKISRSNNTPLTTKKVANLMPKGSTQAIPLANTALGIKGYLYCGIVLVFLGLLLHLFNVRQSYFDKD